MMILSDGYHKLLRPIQRRLVSLIPGKLSGYEDPEEIAHGLLGAAACVTRLGTEIRELKHQVAVLNAKLEARKDETEINAEQAAEAAIAERFDIPVRTLSALDYEDKLEFVTRVVALSSLGVCPDVDRVQIWFDVVCETLMGDPAHFCRELEKFDALRRMDNDKWSWLELYNDLQGKHMGQAYFLNGDPETALQAATKYDAEAKTIS
ncbi:hypothetical protein HDU89_008971 [Geranomyces variabilis]|nr:hypothetical protein HDU89_008971 [Geranomyces variabilis]